MKKIFFAFAAFALSIGVGVLPMVNNVNASAEEQITSIEQVESVEPPVIDETVSVEETPDVEETPENSQVSASDESSENKDVTIDDVLDFAGDMAEEAGIGDKWKEVIGNLKNAITSEQFTVSTIIDVLLLIVMVGYIIYKVIINKQVIQISRYLKTLNATETHNGTTLTAQTNALKEMSSSEEKVLKIGKKLEIKQEYLAQAQEHTNNALLQIVEGINFTRERKTAAIRALNKSNEALDNRAKEDKKDGSNQA